MKIHLLHLLKKLGGDSACLTLLKQALEFCNLCLIRSIIRLGLWLISR